MEIGDKIIWCADYVKGPICSGIVTKISGKDLVWVDNYHKSEDCIYQHWCWPAAAEEELKAIIEHRARLKKQFDQSIELVYQLRNKYSEHKSDG